MKNLLYRFASSCSFAKLFSMEAQLEQRKRVIFFAVLAFIAFVSLGAFVFPHAARAQECVWDCDLGSDILDQTWANSPGYDIVYAIDPASVGKLTDKNGNPIFTSNIPIATVSQTYSDTCPSSSSSGGTVVFGGTVIALLRDKQGNLHPESAAEATLSIIVKNVTCAGSTPSTVLTRPITVNESRTAVFDATSNITILPTPQLNAGNTSLSAPKGWAGCPTDKKTGVLSNACPFPLGIVEFTKQSTLSAALPAVGFFGLGEVYHADESARFVGIRDCKGNANSTDPNTISCTVGGTIGVGGGQSLALFSLPGNWSGSQTKTFNPKSSTGPFDIGPTPLFNDIVFTDQNNPVTASANNGTPLNATSCNLLASQQTLRCFFPANQLLPGGCTTGAPVDIVVRGKLQINNPVPNFKFESTDSPTCNNG
jgi:hypothetical protein